MNLRRGAGVVALGLWCCACGSGGTRVETSSLALPGTAAAALATATLVTSPDGGIYRNPVHLGVLGLARVDPASLAAALGTADRWAAARRLGAFVLVVVELRNDGKAGAEPDLRALQIASDLAPDAAASGSLRSLYHPLFPLAAAADQPFSDGCTPHLDPGQRTIVLLLYPPIRDTANVVWGEYQHFALRFGFGGGGGPLPPQLYAAGCARPVAG